MLLVMAEFQVVRFKHGAQVLEVLCKPTMVLKFREGKMGLDNTLVTDVIFKAGKERDRASDALLAAVFGTMPHQDRLRKMLMEGEVELTVQERREKVAAKRLEVLNYIHKYYIDPTTKLPHPPARLETAVGGIRWVVDPDMPVDRQAQEVIEKLKGVLPLRRCEMEGTIEIPNSMVGSVQGVLHRNQVATRGEDYSPSKCTMNVAFVPGMFDTLMAELNRVTKGEAVFNLANAPVASGAAAATAPAEEETGGRKGKKGGKGGRKGR